MTIDHEESRSLGHRRHASATVVPPEPR